MRTTRVLLTACAVVVGAAGAASAEPPAPIIDVHLHAALAGGGGAPGDRVCTDTVDFPPAVMPPAKEGSVDGLLACASPIVGPATDEELMRRTLELLRTHNVWAVTSGDRERVAAWKAAGGERIIVAGGQGPLDVARKSIASGELKVLGELGFQYRGLAPTDPEPMQWFALAESTDTPIGVHVGPGPPGAPFVASPNYRARLSSPLLYEEVLVKHPKLRLYLMHAGWPMLDDTVNMLYAYPQLYVDTGVIDWAIPEREFYRYLQRLVEAGFGKRILFGSDQMGWPDAIVVAIRRIQAAPFLSATQKRDILYENAARFLRLSDEDRRRHLAP
jgi:predicted TIM-barrel fold metal-dependent hydrolase